MTLPAQKQEAPEAKVTREWVHEDLLDRPLVEDAGDPCRRQNIVYIT